MLGPVTDKWYPLAGEEEEDQQPAKQRSVSTLAFDLAAGSVLYLNMNKLLHVTFSQCQVSANFSSRLKCHLASGDLDQVSR